MSVTIEPGAILTQNASILYQNIFEDGTVTVSSETDDGPGLNAVEDTTFDFWTGAAATSYIEVDYGEAVECDCLGIASHNIGSSGATVTVSASDDGVTFTGVGVSVTPDNDDTIMVVFDLQEYRYWRVNIFDGPASVGVVKLGKRLVMPCGVLSGYTPINHAHDVELLTNMSVQGQFLGTRIKRVGASASIQFGLIDAEFVDEYMQDFEYYFNSGRAFFYAGSPDEWPDDYGYCWRSSGTLAPSLEEGGVLYSVSMEVSVYVEQ